MIGLGITAEGPGTEAGGNALAGALTVTFDLALEQALPDDPRVQLVRMSTPWEEVEADPAAHGSTVVDGDACTDADFSCGPDAWVTADADRTYAFARYGHVTAATRELVTETVHRQVEEAWGV